MSVLTMSSKTPDPPPPAPTLTQRLTVVASLMSKKLRSERSLLFRYITPKLVVSQDTSCFYVCFSCSRPLTPKSASNPSRLSGTLTTSSFLSSLGFTLTLPGALFVIRSSHFLHSLARSSGPIAWVMRAGVGNYLLVVSI